MRSRVSLILLVVVVTVSSSCQVPPEARRLSPADEPRAARAPAPVGESPTYANTDEPTVKPGLETDVAPMLSDAELDHARGLAASANASELASARGRLLAVLAKIEREEPSLSEDDLGELAARAREQVRESAGSGHIAFVRAERFHAEFIYPSDASRAAEKYVGQPVVLFGKVTPHNMNNYGDIYKQFEKAPYPQDPLYLQTDHAMVFVYCHLLAPEKQPLRDWQMVHVLGVVRGKVESDVVLDRCLVL